MSQPIKNSVDELAIKLWGYHRLGLPVKTADVIIALGNSDLRTAQRAAELYLSGMAPWLVTTGGFGRLTSDLWNITEAVKFAEVAKRAGVPADKIIIEDKAPGTIENLIFTEKLLKKKDIPFRSIVLVTKPYMERRAFALAAHLWPNKQVMVTSPALDFDSYPNESVSVELLINMMVGDLQRIILGNERGDIAPQTIPKTVMEAYEALISLGYDKQLLKLA